MKTSRPPSPTAAELRHRAEERLRAAPPGAVVNEEAQRQLHELQVHQIELELQNEELLRSRAALGASAEKYADLYDFAPVSYLTLDAASAIREANLTAATYLGVDRAQLLGQRFLSFLAAESKAPFRAFLERTATADTKEICEVTLPKKGGPPRRARLKGLALAAGAGEGRHCRLVIIDITEQIRDATENRGLLDDAERTRLSLLDTVEDLTRSEAALRIREAEMTEAQRIGHFGSWELELIAPDDHHANPLRWSDEVYRIFGLERSAFGATYEAFLAAVHPADRERMEAVTRRVLAGEEKLNFEHRIVRPDGTVRWVRELAELKRDDAGRATRLTGTVLDITDRKLAEEVLRRLNRLHTVLSNVGEVVVRTRDRQELYENVCRILVEDGLLRMACIMEADVETGRAQSVASAGLGVEYLDEVTVTTDGSLLSQGTMGTALRTGLPNFCNDFANDVRMAPWREKALRHGFFSTASFPLKLGEFTIGLLVLFAGETGYFQDDEIRLMTAVANDLSFALEALQKEEQRQQAEIALRASDAKYRSIFDNASEGIFQNTPEGTFLSANPALARMLGFDSPEELIRERNDLENQGYATPAERKNFLKRLGQAGEINNFEYEVKRRDGSFIWVSENVHIVQDETGQPLYFEGTVQDITERKEAEQALRKSEASLLAAQTVAKIGNWETDLANMVVVWSAEIYRMFGVTKADGEPTHERFLALVHPDDRAGVDAALIASLNDAEPGMIAHRIHLPDGGSKWVEERWIVMCDDQGKPLRAVGTCQDITERKQSENALRESEAKFRHISGQLAKVLDSSLDAICTIDAEGRFSQVSAACERIWGYRTEEMIGQPYLDFVHPEDHPKTTEIAAEIMAGKSIIGFENRYLRKDGSITHIMWSARWSDVEQSMFCVARDYTERHQQEEQIAEQAALIDQAHDAILVRDTGGSIIFWSKGAERLFGWTSAEALGRHYEKLFQPDPAKFEKARRYLDQEGEWSGELEKITKTGHRLTLDCRWTLLLDAAGQPKSYLHFDTDITEWKKIEQQYLRAQRVESIGILASGIAHDLNNVLAPILMSLELLKMRFPDPASQQVLAILKSSAQHGSQMVRQVLSFGRGVEGLQLEVQVKNLIADIEKIIKETFVKNIIVRTKVPGDLHTVLGDPTQLHQVLLNLCVNARDAMPDGGALTLSAENVQFDEHYAAMDPEAKVGSYIMLQVEDSGSGMSPEVMEKIFDPFFTTKELGKGTGLGLSTTMTIVKSHGGFLRLYSEVGKGTKFRIYLPVHTEPADSALPAAAEVEMPRGQSELILVIDDEAAVREIARQTLESFDYRVLLASDGAEAVAIYAGGAKEIAAVLTDMMMPIMDGRATIHALRRINPHVRIIATSGLAAEAHVAKVTSLGVKHFLPKPFTAETLLRTLRKLLDTVE